LVYEYLENRNLDQVLFGSSASISPETILVWRIFFKKIIILSLG
jgi:hypothetical protein